MASTNLVDRHRLFFHVFIQQFCSTIFPKAFISFFASRSMLRHSECVVLNYPVSLPIASLASVVVHCLASFCWECSCVELIQRWADTNKGSVIKRKHQKLGNIKPRTIDDKTNTSALVAETAAMLKRANLNLSFFTVCKAGSSLEDWNFKQCK